MYAIGTDNEIETCITNLKFLFFINSYLETVLGGSNGYFSVHVILFYLAMNLRWLWRNASRDIGLYRECMFVQMNRGRSGREKSMSRTESYRASFLSPLDIRFLYSIEYSGDETCRLSANFIVQLYRCFMILQRQKCEGHEGQALHNFFYRKSSTYM